MNLEQYTYILHRAIEEFSARYTKSRAQGKNLPIERTSLEWESTFVGWLVTGVLNND